MSLDVFILTSDYSDVSGRLEIRFLAISSEGESVRLLIRDQQAVFFVNRSTKLPDSIAYAARREVKLKNFDGQDVDAVYFKTQSGLVVADRRLQELGITTYEADIRPDRRFLMERFIQGCCHVEGRGSTASELTTFINPKLKPTQFFPQLSTASLDIETADNNTRIISIGIHAKRGAQEVEAVFMIGDSAQSKSPISFCQDEKEVLARTRDWINEFNPDVFIGWNVVSFDFRMIVERAEELNLPFKIGKCGEALRMYKRGRSGLFADIPGRIVIDGPYAMRSTFIFFERWSLEFVAQKVLGKGKLIESDEDKVAEIERLFHEDKAQLAAYNLEDCRLVTEIFEATGLLDLWIERTRISGLLLTQIGMSVAAFDFMYLPRLHRVGYVAPNASDVELQGHAAGGYVMQPQTGIYDDVIVLDFKSLYPSIIQSYKIDPLSIIRNDIDPVKTPSDHIFSRTNHILPGIISTLMENRGEAKRQNKPNLSLAIKILMNSFYGVMGASGCRFYHPSLPSAITESGQWILQECIKFIESRGFPVLYGDTDSVFVDVGNSESVTKIGNALAVAINDYWDEYFKKLGLKSHLEMEFEKHYTRFVLPLARAKEGGAAKRYAGLLKKADEVALEFVGMEYVRSDWTDLAKQFQYALYLKVMNGESYSTWINEFVDSVFAGKLDRMLVYRRRLRKNVSEYTKNISPQVRAAKMLNNPNIREVNYLMLKNGPVPISLAKGEIDYEHYVHKQLLPIADALLNLKGEKFEQHVNRGQLRLFD